MAYTRDDGLMNFLTQSLFNSMNAKQKAKFLGKHTTDIAGNGFVMKGANAPKTLQAALGQDGASFKDLGQVALGAASAHPFKTAGLLGLGAGNIGGLTDNDKFGGQLGGLALGGLGSYLMEANPYAAAMMTLGGGELGSLFDKLRARREMEQQPYYGGR